LAVGGKATTIEIAGAGGTDTYLTYEIRAGGKELRIGANEVAKDFQGLDLSATMYRKAYEDASKLHPNIERITGDLMDTNRAVYLKARKPVAEGGKGLEHVDALMATPGYKARAKIGFGRIDEASKVPPATAEPSMIPLTTFKD
jgi:hypothetical protein